LDHHLRLWQTATGKEVGRLEGHTDVVRASAFSPDGKLLASGGGDRAIRVWDLTTRKQLRTLPGHKDWVRCLAFSPDGTSVQPNVKRSRHSQSRNPTGCVR